MLKNYQDIINEIAVNLSWENDVEKNVERILKGVSWAEEQILGKSRGVKYLERILIDNKHQDFILPSDFNTHSRVVVTDRSMNKFLSEEVEYEVLMGYDSTQVPVSIQTTDLAINPKFIQQTAQQTRDDALYFGKVLYALKRTADGYEISIKPKVNGFIFLYYSSTHIMPADIEAKHPSMPGRFWFGIVAGATYYELRRRSSNVTKEEIILSIRAALKDYKEELDNTIAELSALQQERAEPPIAKPFEFWDKPESYV